MSQYAIIQGGLAPELCDQLNAALTPLREHIADRDAATAEKYRPRHRTPRLRADHLGIGNRYRLTAGQDSFVHRSRYIVPEGCDPAGELVEVVTESGLQMKVDVPPQATPGTVLTVAGPGADPVWGVYGHAGDPMVGMGEMVGNQRFHLNLPFVGPFASPEVVEHPLVMRFMEKLWGNEEPKLTVLYCNGPSPGSTFQKWHRDSATDFYDL